MKACRPEPWTRVKPLMTAYQSSTKTGRPRLDSIRCLHELSPGKELCRWTKSLKSFLYRERKLCVSGTVLRSRNGRTHSSRNGSFDLRLGAGVTRGRDHGVEALRAKTPQARRDTGTNRPPAARLTERSPLDRREQAQASRTSWTRRSR